MNGLVVDQQQDQTGAFRSYLHGSAKAVERTFEKGDKDFDQRTKPWEPYDSTT